MITGIHHACFTVSNLKRSIAFYRDILGMEVLWDSVEAGIRYKGERSDKVTGCPGTEQHLVYLGIGGGILELVEYTPTGKPFEGLTWEAPTGTVTMRAKDHQLMQPMCLGQVVKKTKYFDFPYLKPIQVIPTEDVEYAPEDYGWKPYKER